MVCLYVIQNIKTGEFVCGTYFSYDPDENRQRTSLDQMLTFDRLRNAKIEFDRRTCGADYRIVRVKTPEVERVIDFDTPDGYDLDVWEEVPDN